MTNQHGTFMEFNGRPADLPAEGERPLTIVESPFGGEQMANLLYLRRCLRHSWDQGEIPFASHGFFPFFLKESDPAERKAGIEAGYWFWRYARTVVFYTDLGISPGMAAALSRCRILGKAFEIRNIGGN